MRYVPGQTENTPNVAHRKWHENDLRTWVQITKITTRIDRCAQRHIRVQGLKQEPTHGMITRNRTMREVAFRWGSALRRAKSLNRYRRTTASEIRFGVSATVVSNRHAQQDQQGGGERWRMFVVWRDGCAFPPGSIYSGPGALEPERVNMIFRHIGGVVFCLSIGNCFGYPVNLLRDVCSWVRAGRGVLEQILGRRSL